MRDSIILTFVIITAILFSIFAGVGVWKAKMWFNWEYDYKNKIESRFVDLEKRIVELEKDKK